jgi:hypothetical protein
MKKVLLATTLLILALTAVAQAPAPSNERVDHWRHKLSQELPIGSSRDAILAWASKNQMRVTERPKTSELAIRLEQASAIPPGARGSESANAAACSFYRITATMTLDATNSSTSTNVVMAENCF